MHWVYNIASLGQKKPQWGLLSPQKPMKGPSGHKQPKWGTDAHKSPYISPLHINSAATPDCNRTLKVLRCFKKVKELQTEIDWITKWVLSAWRARLSRRYKHRASELSIVRSLDKPQWGRTLKTSFSQSAQITGIQNLCDGHVTHLLEKNFALGWMLETSLMQYAVFSTSYTMYDVLTLFTTETRM